MLTVGLDLLEPGLVHASLAACLVEPGVEDLVLSRGKTLEIYKVSEGGMKLHSVHSFAAAVRDVACVKSSPTDLLLLRFDDCKVSVVKYIEKTGELLTLSMHSWEDEERIVSETEYDFTSSLESVGRSLAVCPDGRCTLVRLNSGNWAFLPFAPAPSDEMEADDPAHLFPAGSRVFGRRRFSDRLAFGFIHDFVFLPGFSEPTLAILYESGSPNFPSQLAVRKETTELLVVALTPSAETGFAFTQLFHRSGLPSECRRMLAVPKPTGGVLLCGPNLFVHVDAAAGGSAQAVCSLNGFAHIACPQVAPPTSLSLKASPCMPVVLSGSSSSSVALWSTAEGDWHWLRMIRGPRGVTSMVVEVVEQEDLCVPSSFTCPNGHVFAASLSGAHQLYRPPTASSNAMKHDLMTDDLYGDDDGLYSEEPMTKSSTAVSSDFVLVCEIPSIGPVIDFCFAPVDADGHFDIVAVGSHGAAGHLTRICSTLPVETERTVTEIASAERLFVLSEDRILVSAHSRTHVFDLDGTAVDAPALKTEQSTLLATVLPDGKVLQVTSSSYVLSSPDMQACLTRSDTSEALQAALAGNVLCLRLAQSIALVQLSSGERVSIDIATTHISCVTYEDSLLLSALLDNGTLMLYKVGTQCENIFGSQCLAFLPQVLLHGGLIPEDITTRYPLSGCDLVTKDGGLFLVVRSDVLTVYRWNRSSFVKIYTAICPTSESEVSPISIGNMAGLSFGSHVVLFGPLAYPRLHRLRRPVKSLAHLKQNVYIGLDDSTVQIEILPRNLVLEHELPFLPYTTKDAIHRIVPCPRAGPGVFAAVTSVTQPFVLPDDEYSNIADNKEWKAPPAIVDASTLPPPIGHLYSISLLGLDNNGLLSVLDSQEMLAYEVPVDLQVANLTTKETGSGRKTFIVLGAALMQGEDRPVRSRVLVFDTVDLVPEPGQKEQSRLKLKQLVAQEIRTGLSTMCPIGKHLALTSGYKTIIHEFEDNDTLTGMAFTDSGIHQVASTAVKSFLWLGDVAGRGLGLYAFQEKPGKLVELGRTLEPGNMGVPVLAVGCLVSGSEICAVAADEDGCLAFYTYNPTSLATAGGTRLRFEGLFKTGDRVLKLASLALPDGQAIGLAWMSPSGALGLLLPSPEPTRKALADAQTRLASEVAQPGGLHPRDARGAPCIRQVVDGTLLVRRLAGMPRVARERLGRDAVSCLESLMANTRLL